MSFFRIKYILFIICVFLCSCSRVTNMIEYDIPAKFYSVVNKNVESEKVEITLSNKGEAEIGLDFRIEKDTATWISEKGISFAIPVDSLRTVSYSGNTEGALCGIAVGGLSGYLLGSSNRSTEAGNIGEAFSIALGTLVGGTVWGIIGNTEVYDFRKPKE